MDLGLLFKVMESILVILKMIKKKVLELIIFIIVIILLLEIGLMIKLKDWLFLLILIKVFKFVI